MKKVVGALIAVLFLAAATTSHAASDDLVDGMANKLIRGVVNTFTGWVEFPAQIIKGYNEGFMDDEDNKVGGVLVGIFQGIGHSAGRTISGIAELTTFWAANPEDQEGVGLPLDAEYAWEEGEPYNAFDPDIQEGLLMPIGNKLVKGLGNIFLGVAEVPGQIMKGVDEGAPDLGSVKGIWYFLSREAQGAADIATVILPAPADTKGLAFDEEWPWDALADNMQ